MGVTIVLQILHADFFLQAFGTRHVRKAFVFLGGFRQKAWG